MIDATTTVLFEYPLNEKMRTWLRLDFLIQQIRQYKNISDITTALAFFRAISDFLDVLERGEIRTDLLKDLERQQRKLRQWSNVPDVNSNMINNLQAQLKDCSTILISAPRIGQALREDRLISLVRQRLGIPGGCCSFDLPTLHMWMKQPPVYLERQVETWLETLTPLINALSLVLQLTRDSATIKPMISLNGFYQDNTEGADLLRIYLPIESQAYPQVSGHKTRFAIRFLPIDSEKGSIPERLIFNLACC